jgi:hypothetical protein
MQGVGFSVLWEDYLQTSVKKVNRSSTNTGNNNDSHAAPSSLSVQLKWRQWDLDMVVGAFGISLSLLTIAIFSYVRDNNGSSPETSMSSFATSQLVGAVLIFLGCIFNVWLIARYRYSTSQGTDNLKRRMISRFLRELEQQEEACLENPSVGFVNEDNGIDLVGTSLTAIYPVFRLSQDPSGKTNGASWSRIPTLLLVQGDLIGLQIGDIAPATCRTLEGKASVVFEKGDTISLEASNNTVEGIVSKFPKGRTTLPTDSDELLDLCNNIRVFEIMETPLVAFLREPEHASKVPQILRQLDAVRGLLCLTGAAVFFLTLSVLLGRYSQFSSDLMHLLPAPFLAALGCLPLVGPSCLILVESLGSARILASYHPVASRTRKDDSATEAAKTNVDILILRYFLAICGNRLSIDLGKIFEGYSGRTAGKRHGSNLVHIPPANLNLLYKLGVATAFSLIDDELVCEPQAIPQQLLIPSGKGLKLLDLCPMYHDGDDETEDSDSSLEQGGRNRQKSFDGDQNYDSDSDSDDALKDHHRVPAKEKKARRRLLRKSFNLSAKRDKDVAEDDSDADLADHEVQFEDPSWWEHLPSLKCIGLACLLVEQKDEPHGRIGSSPFMAAEGSSVIEYEQVKSCKTALVHLICKERRSIQLRSLARCIGFSTKPGAFGSRGDISPFEEKHRLNVISTARMKERLKIDFHERGSEESRWWGLLRADSTSVIVRDGRSGAYQLLTVGDPRVVCDNASLKCFKSVRWQYLTLFLLSTR